MPAPLGRPPLDKRTRRRDRRRARYKVDANPNIVRLLRVIARSILKPLFRVHTDNLDVVNKKNGPMVLLGNHSAVIDPFLIGMFVNKTIHYVVSDSQFRSRAVAWLLNLVGSIPKTKAVSDLDTVKKIVHVKQQGGIIGIFPEGQSSWDGHTLPIVKSTEKLIRSLKVPVVVAQLHGAYFTWPRWARRPRRGRVTIHFRRILTTAQIRSMTVDEVGAEITRALTFDAYEHQRVDRIEYRGTRQAEYLERALFVCPQCNEIGTLHSHRRRLTCRSCDYSVSYNRRGFFEARRGPLRFETIREWNVWQQELFDRYLRSALETSIDLPLLTERSVLIEVGYKSSPLENLGVADPLRLYPDSIEAVFPEQGAVTFPIDQVEGINVQNNEHLEFYCFDNLYRLSTIDPRGNTLKWNNAVLFLQRHYSSPAMTGNT
jgi:1-acyl-sn-glycerol-3-phosphate acyltransferase